jgi:phosphonate transport system substrate-binding protein
MVMLMEKGLVRDKDPKTFFKEFVFAGSHDAGLMALLNGHVDAFASFDQAREQYLKDPAQREKLIWIAESAPIPEGGICARDGLDPALFAKVRAALLSMKGPAYAPILKALYDIDGFEPAEDREYEPVRAAMDLLGWRPKR